MCGHKNPCKNYHVENPDRIHAVWDKLNKSGVTKRCVVLAAKEAEDDNLALVHTKEHIDLIRTISSRNSKTMRKSAKKFNSIYFNKGSLKAAYLAAGSVIEAEEKVANGELDSAFAIVRPPGHHAEENQPMGFCLYNNVAIAASFLLNERPELGMKKILIVDWDVHHGNSTQKMFYQDPRVLFFSVHRHDPENFYPFSDDGSYDMIREGPGAGYNINVPWENDMCGDADYLAVWDNILIPVAKEFDPDMIIISAGFDAVIDDPIGGCCVSPNGFSIMLHKLMCFAKGKIVMALEGGYNPSQLAHSVQACIEVLLEETPLSRSLEDRPLDTTWRVIQSVGQALCVYWPVLAAKLPDIVIKSTTSQIGIDIGGGHVSEEEASRHTTSLQTEFTYNFLVFDSNLGRRDDLESAQACEYAYEEQEQVSVDVYTTGIYDEVWPTFTHRKRGREGPHDTSPRRKLGKGLFSDGLNSSKDLEAVCDSSATSLSGDKMSDDDIKLSLMRSAEEFESQLNQSLTKMDMLFSTVSVNVAEHDKMSEDDIKLSLMRSAEEFESQLNKSLTKMDKLFSTVPVNGAQHEVHHATHSSTTEKISRDEVAYLREENKQLKAAKDRAEKALDHEITTGEKFLDSEFGKEWLKKAGNDAVDEFKKSQAFHKEISDAVSQIHGEAMQIFLQRFP